MADKARVRDTDTIGCDARLTRIGTRDIVRLPAAASSRLPSRGQVAATVVINGHAFGTVLEPDGRRGHWIPIDAGLTQALELSDGDDVSVEIEPAGEWPEPDVPADLRAALAGAPDVAEVWEDITPMARWEWVRWVNATRNPDTRERRIDVSVSKLQSGKRRPCCFDLSACTDPDLSKSGKLIGTA